MSRTSRAAEAAPAARGRTYRVIGPHPVHEVRPGGVFTKELEAAQERFLLDLRHIEIVEAIKPDSETLGADDGADKEQT